MLQDLCLPFSHVEVGEVMASLDTDGSGEISYEEFYQVRGHVRCHAARPGWGGVRGGPGALILDGFGEIDRQPPREGPLPGRCGSHKTMTQALSLCFIVRDSAN